MTVVVFACFVLLVVTTVIHYEALGALGSILPELDIPPRAKLIVVIVATFLAHVLEMILYGLAFFTLVRHLGLGTLSNVPDISLSQGLYFSAETYTSLGFGDVVPTGPVRLLAGSEALNGLLLIGWSASYTYIAMERYWKTNGTRR